MSVFRSWLALWSLQTYPTGVAWEPRAWPWSVLQDVCPWRPRLGWPGREQPRCDRSRGLMSTPTPSLAGAWCRGGNARREPHAAGLNPLPFAKDEMPWPKTGDLRESLTPRWFWNLSLPRVGCKSLKPQGSAVSLRESGPRCCWILLDPYCPLFVVKNQDLVKVEDHPTDETRRLKTVP